MNNNQFYFERLTPKGYSTNIYKAKPLARIYHNPILKPSYKRQKLNSYSPANLSLKVLELQLPSIPIPKLFQKYFMNSTKPIHHKKKPPRSISIMPDLYIIRSSISPQS